MLTITCLEFMHFVLIHHKVGGHIEDRVSKLQSFLDVRFPALLFFNSF